MTPVTDGTSDAELLRAISANAECAHVLAAIAAGGNARELIATLAEREETEAHERSDLSDRSDMSDKSDKSDSTSPQPAMYQSAITPAAPADSDSCPSFLSNISPDFWDNF